MVKSRASRKGVLGALNNLKKKVIKRCGWEQEEEI
jgi:hypothetical protein